jgi:hypothetical protein
LRLRYSDVPREGIQHGVFFFRAQGCDGREFVGPACHIHSV